jgi:hypothetical protein
MSCTAARQSTRDIHRIIRNDKIAAMLLYRHCKQEPIRHPALSCNNRLQGGTRLFHNRLLSNDMSVDSHHVPHIGTRTHTHTHTHPRGCGQPYRVRVGSSTKSCGGRGASPSDDSCPGAHSTTVPPRESVATSLFPADNPSRLPRGATSLPARVRSTVANPTAATSSTASSAADLIMSTPACPLSPHAGASLTLVVNAVELHPGAHQSCNLFILHSFKFSHRLTQPCWRLAKGVTPDLPARVLSPPRML